MSLIFSCANTVTMEQTRCYRCNFGIQRLAQRHFDREPREAGNELLTLALAAHTVIFLLAN